MKLTSSTRVIVAIFVVVGLAVVFWMALLSPKRKEADELGTQVENLKATLAVSQGAAAEAEQARREFPQNYRQLVVLGKAVPAGDETASLLVELSSISEQTETDFEGIELSSTAGSEEAPPPEPEVAAPTEEGGEEEASVPAATVAPTESSVASMPIGATVGPAAFPILPYKLAFQGSFFDVADFIEELDGFVHTEDPGLKVDGRLVTIDGFSLTPQDEDSGGSSRLKANFAVTTFLVPSDQGLTAGASEAGPTEVAVTPEEEESIPR
jgi:Tfp pilus assembly protein PilO